RCTQGMSAYPIGVGPVLRADSSLAAVATLRRGQVERAASWPATSRLEEEETMTVITGVSTRVFRVPFERLIGDANDPVGRKTTLQMVVELSTDDGLTGLAIGHPPARPIVHSFGELLV